jgi:protein phosphatase
MTAPPLSLRYAALSDVGRVRKDNQDSGFASEHLLVVADGVGGAVRGDLASSTAVQSLRRLDGPPPEDLVEALAGAIHRAHDRIAELVEADPGLDGTSTTVTAALFDGGRLAVGHVGDSRGYLYRRGELRRLTKDHTFVQTLIDEGRITEEESRVHPHKNLILRAVDGVHDADPDLSVVDLEPDDRILLCSDGCCGVLDDARIADILGTGSADFAVVELVRASLDASSTDNVTCVVADVVAAPAAGAEDGATDGEAAALPPSGQKSMLVGAAAEQPRRAGARSFFRGHRSGDTGELEPVRDGTDLAEVDPEELRYAPRPPRRFVWLRRGAVLVVLARLVWVVGTLIYRWTQDQYFVAADGPNVAIYKGVQADLPGVTLNHLYEETPVTLASLPGYRAGQVRGGISAENLADAHHIVQRLTGLARVCPTPTPTPTPSPSPGKTATHHRHGKHRPHASAGPSPTPSAGPSTGPSAAPSPAPTPTLKPPNCIKATS